MASELETMNFKSIAMSLQNIGEEMATMRAEVVELKKVNSQLIQRLDLIQQRQLHGLVAQVGSGPTS